MKLKWEAAVRPAFGKDDRLPADAQAQASITGVQWLRGRSGLLPGPKQLTRILQFLDPRLVDVTSELPHPHAMTPGFAKWKHSATTARNRSHSLQRDARWYWASASQTPTSMNSFISRPALEPRALFWLAAKHGIRGMLYYSVDQWARYSFIKLFY